MKKRHKIISWYLNPETKKWEEYATYKSSKYFAGEQLCNRNTE